MVNQDINSDIACNEKALNLLDYGINEFFKKNYSISIKLIEEAYDIFLSIDDISNTARCLAELSIVKYKASKTNFANSSLLLEKARQLIIKVSDNEEIQAKIIHYLGKLYYYEKRFTEALIFYSKALKQANEGCLEYAKILDSLAIFYLRLNNYQISVKYLQKSLNIKKKICNRPELAFTELLYGRHLLNIENYESASVHLNKALTLNANGGYELFEARILEELAKIHIYIEDYDMAKSFCQKAISLAEETDSKLLLAFALSTMANIKAQTEDISQALSIISRSAEIFQSFDNTRGLAFLEQTGGIIDFKIGNIYKAKEKLYNSIKLFKNLGVLKEIVRGYYYLACVYRSDNDVQSSLCYTLEAMRIAKANNYPFLVNKIESLLYDFVEKELPDISDIATIEEDTLRNNSSLFDNISLFGNLYSHDNAQNPLISLLKIGKAIYNEVNPHRILDIATFETQNALNADRCSIFLYDKYTNELYSRVASGLDNQEIRFPANLGLAGYVYSTGQIIKIDDAYNDPNFNKEIDYKTGYKTKNLVCIPLRNSNHEIIGVFQVINKLNDEFFTDKDVELLVSISTSIGASLDNASLLKRQMLMYEEQNKSFKSFVNTLATSIEARDKITAGHSARVTAYSLAIIDQLGWDAREKEVIEYAAILHDIGKIGIRDEVLCKEGKLTDEEYKHIQEHARITYEILEKMYFQDRFRMVPEIAASHHEKFNGKGYYRGLAGEDIPIGGRILAIADVFDAITSKRHYRDRMPFKQALNILKNDSGSHFDGNLVDKFFEINLSHIVKILSSRYKNPVTLDELRLLSEYSINDLYSVLIKSEETELNEYEQALLDTFLRHYVGE